MKTKKVITVAVIALILTLLTLLSAPAATYPMMGDSPQVNVTLISQTPDPVEPGSIVTIKFKVENRGSQTTYDAIIALQPKYPFSLYGDQAEKNIGKLKSDTTGADAMVVEYKLRVDGQAMGGDTELELLVKMGDSAIAFTDNQFLIDVRTPDSILDITSVSVEPQPIVPGGTADLEVMVKNLDDNLMKDIKFTLNISSSDFPLAPYQSSSQRRISQLPGGAQQSLLFSLIANPKATAGLYKIPVTITYYDERGTLHTATDVLAVTVGESPKLRAFVKKSTILQAGTAGKITVELANAGKTDLKFVELQIQDSGEFRVLTPSTYFYIGDVDSDDTESEEIDFYVNDDVETLTLPLLIKYYDANNKPFQQAVDLTLPLYSSRELQKFGLVPASKTWLIGVILILLGGGYLVYRYRFAKTK